MVTGRGHFCVSIRTIKAFSICSTDKSAMWLPEPHVVPRTQVMLLIVNANCAVSVSLS